MGWEGKSSGFRAVDPFCFSSGGLSLDRHIWAQAIGKRLIAGRQLLMRNRQKLIRKRQKRIPIRQIPMAIPCPWTRFGRADSRAGFHQCLAQGGEDARQRNGLARGRPARPIHADKELPGPEWSAREQDFQSFSAVKVLDRNTQVSFHKCMVTEAVLKSSPARPRASSAA